MANMIQQHRLLARPGLISDFKDSYNKWPANYVQWMKTGSHDRPEIAGAIVTGPNRLKQTRELEPVSYDPLVTGPKVMATEKTYKKGYMLSKEAIDDDGYGKLNQGARFLADAAWFTREFAAVGVIDDAYTGTNFKGMDNLPLFSVAHTLINSTATVANRPTTPISLSVAGFTTLMDLARKCKNENGDPITIFPNALMIGNDQGQVNKAYQILESSLEPFTANNQDNPIRRNFKPSKVVINPYRTNVFHYEIFDEKYNDIWFLDREKITTRDWYDPEVDASKIRARGRWIIWFRDWRGWYGTNPSA